MQKICTKQPSANPKQCGIKYTHLMIAIMIIFMIIFIIDRFTTNLWPLYFTKASPIEHDMTATSFFVIGWIMGRELIVASSLIWLFECKCFWNFVFEHKPNWLIVDDIMIENNCLHYHLGWFGIGVPMVTHTWLVFFPLLQKHELHIYLSWWRPIDPSTNFYLENCHHQNVNVSINDIYALFISTLVFLVLFPIAMHSKFKKHHWTFAHYLHIFAAALYSIELLRTPFTAHCWYIATPFIVCYIIDRFLGIFYYRFTNNATIIHQYNVDSQYILLFMNIPTNACPQIGDVFWLNTKEFGYYKLQPSHPFTTFYNHQSIVSNKRIEKKCKQQMLGHRKHKFGVKSKGLHIPVSNTHLCSDQSYELIRRDTRSELETLTTVNHLSKSKDNETNILVQNNDSKNNEKLSFWSRTLKSLVKKSENSEIETNNSWNVGFLIRVHQRNDKFSFTAYVKHSACSDKDMLAYGPYRSSFANIVTEMKKDNGSIVLIGTGAGAAYIIDFMLYLRAKVKGSECVLNQEIRIHFSCRSIKLFQWITDFLCEESIENVHICAHLTSHKNVCDYDESQNLNKVRKAKIGRASFSVFLKESPPKSKVFFCGSPIIQSKLRILCEHLNFTFFEGHSFH